MHPFYKILRDIELAQEKRVANAVQEQQKIRKQRNCIHDFSGEFRNECRHCGIDRRDFLMLSLEERQRGIKRG